MKKEVQKIEVTEKMGKNTTFKILYKYEDEGAILTEHRLIDAVDKASAKDIWLRCYKDEEDTLINVLYLTKSEKDEIKKSREERRKYHENRLKNKGGA